jgi:ABC-type multidrug transport system ATPase subunit
MAMEMVINPSILFLDEPTSGLDTFTAYSVVTTLKDLASQGRTVVATIHQPSSDIFMLFDDLLLLSEGRVVYYGEAKDAVSYFARAGYECPQYMNPSDYIFVIYAFHSILL